MAGALRLCGLGRSMWRAALPTLLLATALLCPALSAQTIENIAQARWIERGIPREASSNRVTLEVEARSIAIATYRAVPFAAQSLSFTPTSCTQGDAAAPRTAPVEPASAFHVGETILIEVVAPFANRDPATPETVTLVVSSSRGDRQVLSLPETGPDTGRFATSLTTVGADAGIVAEDCRLSVEGGGMVALAPEGAMGEEATLRHEVAVLAEEPDDAAGDAITLAQSVSRPVAQPGDALLFTLTAGNPDASRAAGGR